jgi:hypothetical protein
MHRRYRWLAVGLVAAALTLPGCAKAPEEEAGAQSGTAQVEAIAGSDLSRIVLTEDAVRRTGITTQAVRAEPVTGKGANTAKRTIIPTAAVLYDADGATWVYTNPEPRTYVRQRIVIFQTTGAVTVLQSGPPAGTAVVTVGGAELLGTEYGVEGE